MKFGRTRKAMDKQSGTGECFGSLLPVLSNFHGCVYGSLETRIFFSISCYYLNSSCWFIVSNELQKYVLYRLFLAKCEVKITAAYIWSLFSRAVYRSNHRKGPLKRKWNKGLLLEIKNIISLTGPSRKDSDLSTAWAANHSAVFVCCWSL